MHAFLRLVLNELRQGLFQTLAVVILSGIILGVVYRRHKRRYGSGRPFPWKKALLILVLVGYLAMLSYATLQRLGGMGASGVSLHLFRAWREAWNNFSVTSWLNLLLNIAMFVPLGILLPLVWKRFRKWYRMLAAGLAVSLYIEVMQLIGSRGILDIDDLFANTLGAMLGFCLLSAALALSEKRWLRAWGHIALALIPVAVVCGIFFAYHIQPYGNLPGAATHRVDTGKVDWVLACDLTREDDTAPIYYLEPPPQAKADAMRDQLAALLGVEFERTDYYDESTMYMDQMGSASESHFLTVRRLDGTWDYTGIYDNRTPAETDRETIEALLADFGVIIPGEAEFSYLNSGIHQFTVNRLTDGSKMMDGILTCVYNEEGMLSEIDNRILTYTHHGDAAICSPQEAYERLCRGGFAAFTRTLEGTVTVTEWELSYAVDTKGFLQPVYRFAVTYGPGGNKHTILIPALS